MSSPKTEKDLRATMRATPAGQLLSRMGLDYYDTESQARRVAEHAVTEAEKARAALADLREIVCRDFLPQIAHCTCQDYGQMNRGLMLATEVLGEYPTKGRKKT